MLSPFYYLGNTRFNVNTNILLFNCLLCLTAFWNHLHRQSCVCKDANLRESVSQNTPPIPRKRWNNGVNESGNSPLENYWVIFRRSTAKPGGGQNMR